jgi:hypothetical protein
VFFRYFANKEDLALSFIRDSSDALLRYMHDRDHEIAGMLAAFEASAGELKSALAGHWT